MDGIPPVLSRDSEDVAWALQTAEALWKRGERVDAIVWLRRAAQAAGEAEDDNRAVMLARNAAELTDWIASHTMSGTPPAPENTSSHRAVDDLLGDLPRPPESETFSLGIERVGDVSVVSADEFESGLRAPSNQPTDPRGTLTSDSEVMTISVHAGDVELVESGDSADDDDLDTDIAHPDRARLAELAQLARRDAREIDRSDMSGEVDVGEIELLPSDPPPRFDQDRDVLPSFTPPPVPSAEALHAGMLDPWSDPERRSALPQPPDGAPPRNAVVNVKLKGPASRFDDEEVVTSAKGASRPGLPPAVPPAVPSHVSQASQVSPPLPQKGPPPMRPRVPPPPVPPPRRPPPMRALPREEPAEPQDDPVTAQFAKLDAYPPPQASRSLRAPALEPALEAIEHAVVSESPLSLADVIDDDDPQRSTMESAILAPPPILDVPPPSARPTGGPSRASSSIPAPHVPPASMRAAPRPAAPTPFRTPPPPRTPPPVSSSNAAILPATAPPPSLPTPSFHGGARSIGVRAPAPTAPPPTRPRIPNDEPTHDDLNDEITNDGNRPTPIPQSASDMPLRASHSKMPTPPIPSSDREEAKTGAPPSEDAIDTQVSSRAPPPDSPVRPPSASKPFAPLELSGVEALGDLPDEAREEFARVARIEVLALDEEVSNFALALVIDGEVDISSPLVDAPALRLERNAILRSRGTLDDGVQLRLVCASESARVATWNDAAVLAAFRSCPWVEEDLRALADVVQTKVGVTMGPLGERFDMGLREHVTSKLIVRALTPGEEIATQGKAVHGLIVVGVGEIDLFSGDAKTGVLRSGDFLFPNEVLSSGKAPATARAGKNGALILSGDRRTTNELLMSFPPLLEFLAMG